MNDAKYVRHENNAAVGDIFLIWYGGDLIVVASAVDGTEIDCWHEEGLETHLDAYGSMTGWLDTQEDMNADHALDDLMGV